MLCIIGPSGSGKSTLLSVLAGQLEPSRGRVRLNDASLYQNRLELIRFIAYMPQEEALNPQLTVREHLRHATTIRRPFLSSEKVGPPRRRDSCGTGPAGHRPPAGRLAGRENPQRRRTEAA
jgi:ABC-type multidrug transport system ATPase subunit